MEKNRLRILAIDDNQDNLISVKALIKEAFPNAFILTALEGGKGIQLAQTENPHVILLDVVMPGMDGFEVCRKLKSDPQTRDIPVVFLTALKGDKESRIRALEVGAEAFLAKPIDEIELIAQIRAMQKIQAASERERAERENLNELVAKRSRELDLAHTAALNLLEDLRKENETRRKSEERLRLITDNMVDLIARFDAQAFFQYVSPSYEKILGYRAEDLVGKWAVDFLHPDERDETIQALDAMLRSGAGAIQFRFRHKDGSYRWIESTGKNLLNADGQVIGSTMGSRDITERKQAEEALRQSEELFRVVLTNILDPVFITDDNGQFTFICPNASTLLGYSLEEIQALGNISGLVGDGLSSLEELETRREITNIERVIVDRDGRQRIFLTTVRRVSIGSGTRLYTFHDITERKQAQDALLKSTELLEKTLSSLLDAVFIIDADTVKIVDCNPAAAAIFGYSRQELLGQTTTFLHVDQAALEEFRQYLNSDMQAGKDFMFLPEFKMKRKDGTVFISEHSVVPLKNEQGRRTGWVSVVRDITERKQIEETLVFLLQSGYRDEDFFHSLARHLSSSLKMNYICIDRLAGDQLSAKTVAVFSDGKFEDDIEYTLKDTPCGDVVGKAVCVFPSQVRHLFPKDAALQELGAESYLGTTLWGSRGEPIGLIAVIGRNSLTPESQHKAESILQLVAVRAAGELERQGAEAEIFQLNASLEQRITERTRALTEAQEQLIHQERLAVLGQLAGGVSHELRNPLGVINSAIYYLKMVQPDANDNIQQYHAMIEQEVHNAEKIINDMLDFVRGIPADREHVAVAALVQGVLEQRPVPPSVQVALELPADLPKIYADPRQLRQVLGNLVVNACQAMNEAGKLSVSGKQLTVSGEQWVSIAVKDTGTGILPENMPKLFEPLFTTKARGIGLGLAVSKKLIEANRGRIEVESEPGKGSTFTVFLPLEDTQPTK